MAEKKNFLDTTRAFSSFSKKAVLIIGALLFAILLVRVVAGMITGHQLANTINRLEDKWKSLDPITLAPSKVPDFQNAAKFYKASRYLLFYDQQDSRELYRIATKPDPAKIKELEPKLREILDNNKHALTLIALGSKKPFSNWEIPYEKGIHADLPRLLKIIYSARLLTAKALFEIWSNHPSDAIETLEKGFAYSNSFKMEPKSIVQLIRISMNKLYIRAIREMLIWNELSNEELLRLTKIIEKSNIPNPIHQGILGEMKDSHFMFLKSEKGTYIISEYYPSLITVSPLINWLLRPIIQSDHRFCIEHMDRLIEYCDIPRYERALKHKISPLDEKPKFFQTMSKTFKKIIESSILRGDLAETRYQMTRVAIALRRFRMDNSAYPEDLGALAPDYLDEVPIDPFSGKPFFYNREGKGFILRSEVEDPKYEELGGDKVLLWKIER